MPPTAAFVAKAWIVREGVDAGAWALVTLMMLSALFMLLALVRAWAAVFWRLRRVSPEVVVARRGSARWATGSCALLVGGVVVTSLGANTLHRLMSEGGSRIEYAARDLATVYTPPEPASGTTGKGEGH